jgi:Do/DeqQ family serine protease
MMRLLMLFGLYVLLIVPVQAQKVVPETPSQIRLSFAPIVKKAAPAVVNIFSKRVIKQRASPFLNDPFFRRFLGRDQGLPRARVEKSLGSGVIVNPDGIIVTNNHVVKGSTEIQVVLADRREFSARIILTDEKTDLAVLKIDPGNSKLPFIKFRNSDDLEVGDLVLAIGNPFGVGQTVTSGIVSALARTQVGVSNYQFFIQTDAAINPGNSGGALIDVEGELVGINTAIFSRSGGSNGIGFAIPANMVQSVVEAARVGKSVKRPWLGARLQKLTSELAESFGLSKPVGVLVGSVYPKGPAANAGLKRGDIILSINGFDVFAPTEFNFRFATQRVGRTVEVKFQRRGQVRTSRINLISPPEKPPARLTRLRGNQPLAQVRVANLSPAVVEEMQLKSAVVNGVVIVDTRRSLAGRYGLKRGDIIKSVQGIDVKGVRNLVKILKTPYDYWEITVQRGAKTFTWRIGG